MHIAFSFSQFLKSGKIRVLLLALTWCLGAIFTFHVFGSASDSYVSLMRSASARPVSIVGMLIVVILPFLITAIAVYYSKPILIFLLCFLKSFSYTLCLLSIYGAFGSAGWLLHLLLMFTENSSMVLLWIVWYRCLLGAVRIPLRGFCCYLAAAILVGIVDILVVSPFAVSVIIF